jgi:hypothetical protein
MLDVAVLHCGDVQAVVDIAQANNLSVTSELLSGQLLLVPDPFDEDVVIELKRKNARPASKDVAGDSEPFDGVEYWGIELDFEVQ